MTEPVRPLIPQFPASAVSSALIQAYWNTDYTAIDDAEFVLNPGQASGALRQRMAQHRCDSAVYLTACNPFSRMLGVAENTQRQAQLAMELERRGLVYVAGVGRGKDSEWAAEPSFLIYGMALEDAKVLGRQFGQNALVWCGPDAVPQLVLLR